MGFSSSAEYRPNFAVSRIAMKAFISYLKAQNTRWGSAHIREFKFVNLMFPAQGQHLLLRAAPGCFSNTIYCRFG